MIRLETDGAVARLTLDRPPLINQQPDCHEF